MILIYSLRKMSPSIEAGSLAGIETTVESTRLASVFADAGQLEPDLRLLNRGIKFLFFDVNSPRQTPAESQNMIKEVVPYDKQYKFITFLNENENNPCFVIFEPGVEHKAVFQSIKDKAFPLVKAVDAGFIMNQGDLGVMIDGVSSSLGVGSSAESLKWREYVGEAFDFYVQHDLLHQSPR